MSEGTPPSETSREVTASLAEAPAKVTVRFERSVIVGYREDLLSRVLSFQFRVVVPHVLLCLLYELVIRLCLDDFAAGAMNCLHGRLLWGWDTGTLPGSLQPHIAAASSTISSYENRLSQ